MKRARNTAAQVFAAPAAIAAASLAGLTAGLIGDDVWDVIAWAGLAAPLLAIAATRLHPPQL